MLSPPGSALPSRAGPRNGAATPVPVDGVVRITLLLLSVFALAWVSLAGMDTARGIPVIWPAGAVLTGLLLTTPRRLRAGLFLLGLLLILAAYLLEGYPWALALGYSLSFAVSSWVVRWRLVAGLGGRRAALRDQGDVSQLVGAIAIGSVVAALGCAFTDKLIGEGNPLLGALGAFGSSAAAMMVLLPLFVQVIRFKPVAGPRERVVQALLTSGTTFLVFVSSEVPPVVFAVMPMFAWHAFRGTLREATILLGIVGVIGSSFTIAGAGPIWGLVSHYGLAPEVVSGVLQLFLIDCGLILLPLSVMVTQQRMSAARADAERETLQRVVASATGIAIIATARDGRITLFNPGAEQILGYYADEVIGKRPDMFHPEEELRQQAANLDALPTFVDICRASIALGETDRLWRFRRSDGEERTMRMTLTAVPGQHGELAGYLATAEDVTEREAAQRAMLLTLQHQRTAVERLRELERVKGDFVSTVSHELRTPITSIIGYTELLGDGAVGGLTDPQQDIVDRVDRNGRRLLLLVEDLLTLSQIESSSLKLEPVVTDIREVVMNAYAALGDTLRTRTLDVFVNLPDEPVVHHGDPVQLERMVTNLMTNAVKFTPDGGAVDVTLSSDGEHTEIIVADDGVGISDEDQSQLFNRFFRSTVASEQAIQGTGLGLTIVQAIVALHGGRIEVSSADRQGTRVTVTLPRVALGTVAPETQCPESEVPMRAPRKRPSYAARGLDRPGY